MKALDQMIVLAGLLVVVVVGFTSAYLITEEASSAPSIVRPLLGFQDHGGGRVTYCVDGHRILEVRQPHAAGGVALLAWPAETSCQ